MIDFILQTALGLTRLALLVFVIIMPLMILLEISRYYGALKKLTGILSPLTSKLGYEVDSVYPLLAGIVFGISYGGGVLIGEAKKGNIVGRQAFLVALLLAMCHAVFEDTLLFVSQGAIWWIIIGARLILAFGVTISVALMLKKFGR